jgi:hypothetical protein
MAIRHDRLTVLSVTLAVATFAPPTVCNGEVRKSSPGDRSDIATQRGGMSAARAAAIQECSVLAGKIVGYGDIVSQINLYRTCMARHGQPE